MGKEKDSGMIRIKVDRKFYQPTEVDYLQDNADKACKNLEWKSKVSFIELVKEMVASDIKLMKDNPNA